MPRFNLIRRLQAVAVLRKRPLVEPSGPPPEEARSQRSGPPAIALARARFAGRADVRIDPLETDFHVEACGLAVRAWVILDLDEMPAELLKATTAAEHKLSKVPPVARKIFFLAAAYGLSTSDVARLLGLSRRSTRRWLMRAIAALDGRRL